MGGKMHKTLTFAVAIALCGCARSATMQLSADTFQLVTSAAPVCSRTGAQNVAARRAAIETINRGYDKFLILGGAAENNVRVVGHTPVQAHTVATATATGYGNMVTATGSSTTTYTGGNPIIAGVSRSGSHRENVQGGRSQSRQRDLSTRHARS